MHFIDSDRTFRNLKYIFKHSIHSLFPKYTSACVIVYLILIKTPKYVSTLSPSPIRTYTCIILKKMQYSTICHSSLFLCNIQRPIISPRNPSALYIVLFRLIYIYTRLSINFKSHCIFHLEINSSTSLTVISFVSGKFEEANDCMCVN